MLFITRPIPDHYVFAVVLQLIPDLEKHLTEVTAVGAN
jgi:hypothetical protein